ncbi:phosphoribosylaminoimidazolesuccinocarboxamide synthase [Spirochaeta dissipatitropha]
MNSTDVFSGIDIPAGWQRYSGKVREALWSDRIGVLLTTDRISAYDVILGDIPGKGAVLNQLSLFWLEHISDILPNHLIEKLGPRSVAVKRCEVLPVEVIVRAYLTGSSWRSYSQGQSISGIQLPPGLTEHHKFETPIITPSTKAEIGDHDEPVSREEIISRGLVPEKLWNEVEEAALALFARGSDIAARNGLALVDTKYEFGLYNGQLHIVDEVHTPDSSRYWYADHLGRDGTVPQGKTPRQLDKEFLRDHLRSRGFTGDGTPPDIDSGTAEELFTRYCELYNRITGQSFAASVAPIDMEIPLVAEFLEKQR